MSSLQPNLQAANESLKRLFALATDIRPQAGKESHVLVGTIDTKNKEAMILLEEEDEFALTGVFNFDPETNTFTFQPRIDVFGYESYRSYFEHVAAWWDKDSWEQIVEHQWLVFSSQKYLYEQVIQQVAHFLRILSNRKYFYSLQNILILFNSEPLEIALKAKDSTEFCQILQDFSAPQLKALNELCQWLSTDIDNKNYKAKQQAFSLAVRNNLGALEGRLRHDINDLFKQIEKIKEQALELYSQSPELTAANQFITANEETQSKLITRVNKVFNRCVVQVLVITILTALVYNIDLVNQAIIMALLIACVICSIVLTNQVKLLSYFEQEVKQILAQQTKLQTKLQTNEYLKEQISYQKRLASVLGLRCWVISSFSLFF
ncbi:hypothetical protein [Psittacicella hinzii]|uniref:Uncharacterized protein n=1 Tax=Psittacicella hinzii TaxID=2028575 RepID=A0A3A1YS21_9GAMM|nr:hypothetical protein [Psittacicella hinzii]RIY39174.1 hypothetical protein CKF58_02730 [Psittacicella hinzii]